MLSLACQSLSSVLQTSKDSYPALLISLQPHSFLEGLGKHRKLYTSVDWMQAKYYETTNAVRVGLKLVYFTRGPSGILISVFDTSLQKWVSSKEFPWLSDADGWNYELYYQTISIVAMNLKMYIYARASLGSNIAEYDSNAGTLTYFPSSSYLCNGDGFTTPEYYRTVRIAAVGSLLYISARDPLGIHLASFEPSTSTWTVLPTFTQFIMTNTEWVTFGYYTTFK